MENEISRADRLHTAIDLMIRIMRQHHRIVEKRLEGIGVHHSQHRMLMRLSAMGKTASQKDIAAKMEISPACVARMLKALSAGGLIEKAEGLQDGRCNEISISPQGQAVIHESHQRFRRIDEEMFNGFSVEEILQFSELLQRVQNNLSAMEQDPERSDAN